MTFQDQQTAIEHLRESRGRIHAELSKVIIGQEEAIHQLLITLFSGGHCLLTGAPGLAKTLLVHSIAQIFHLRFQRIQFTPDLMPADITGTEILEETKEGGRSMQFVKGPIFANVILADEINRTPPKTQAALLEAMQEHQVTAAGVRYPLEEPFFVLATQNPIEMEGTYPLPEAQLDRFMFNILIDYLPENDEVRVVQTTTAEKPKQIQPIFSGEDVLQFHAIVRQTPVAEPLVRYAVQIAAASRPGRAETPEFINKWVSWGAGLRAAQNLILGAKAHALLADRMHVTLDDIQALVPATLRHRVLMNYRAEAEGVTVEDVVDRLIEHIQPPVQS
ncbi:MAG TPA: AAA family ATPase [Planctomycetes bacterium]|nr:AAA family ATPase [Planctomycetaceae bacterium]HIM27933.1 AAA family ATPase [Planctomycetota bacterium]